MKTFFFTLFLIGLTFTFASNQTASTNVTSTIAGTNVTIPVTGLSTATPNVTANTTRPVVTTAPTSALPHVISNATVNTYNYTTENDTVCVLATMKVHFIKSGAVINVTDDAHVIEDKSNCGKLAIGFGLNNFTLHFKKDSRLYWLHQIDAYIASYGNVVTTKTNLTIGKASLGASYQCNTGFSLNLTDVQTIGATDVQFQAFQFKKNGEYGTAQICSADIGNNIIIPIAVGCALVGLIIIVLIAYMIGRKQVKHRYAPM